MIDITNTNQNVSTNFNCNNNTLELNVTEETTIVNIEIAQMGVRGLDGKSAYQIAVDNDGFIGTEEQWIESLRVIIFENLDPLP